MGTCRSSLAWPRHLRPGGPPRPAHDHGGGRHPIHLAERTLHHLQQARDERTVVRVIKERAGPHSIEIHRIEVEGDRVSVWLLYGVPLERAREIAAPRDLISEELHGDRIAFEIAQALGRDIDLEFTGMLKFEASGHAPYLPQAGAPVEED